MKHILTILIAILGFATAAAQEIPQYDVVEVTPADGTTVSALTTITVSLSREGYDAPLGIMPGAAAVEAVRLEGTTETPIVAPKASVDKTNGNLLITFAEAYNIPGTVEVRIPAGLTNNLAMPVATMTTDEIIAEGGCTNPAITLTLNVEPSILPVKDVTGVGYDTQYLTDEQGNFIKDEKGQYVRVDKYDSLIDAQLEPTNGDRVTVLYFWFDEAFASISYKGGASVTNVTTGTSVGIASVGFKSGGDSHRNDVIELRLSTADYIQSEEFHQGVYEVVLPEGIATTADGRMSGGKTFRFTFGDPDKAFVPQEMSLDDYLGEYKAMAEEGEENTGEFFTFTKEDGTYYVDNLDGSHLRIPVENQGEKFFLKYTDAAEGAFMSFTGGDVEVLFQKFEGEDYIYIDQYALYPTDGEPIMGGVITFKKEHSVIDALAAPVAPANDNAVYDLQGRRISNADVFRGIYVQNGHKTVK